MRASALAEHIKPVVVIPEEAPEDEEPENLIEISSGPPAGEPAVSFPPASLPYVALPLTQGWAQRRVCPSTGLTTMEGTRVWGRGPCSLL